MQVESHAVPAPRGLVSAVNTAQRFPPLTVAPPVRPEVPRMPTPVAPAPTPPESSTRFTRLNRLTAALGRGFDIRLQPGPAWTYAPQQRTITCPPAALEQHSDAFNMGTLCRELGHLRYGGQAPADAAQDGRLRYLWHVLESQRTGRIVAGRYAGAGAMLAEVYQTEAAPADAPDVVRMGEGLLAHWRGDHAYIESLDAHTQAAVAALQPLMDSLTAPPAAVDLRFDDLSREENTAAAQQAARDVQQRLLPAVLAWLPASHSETPQDAPSGQQTPDAPQNPETPQDAPSEQQTPAAPQDASAGESTAGAPKKTADVSTKQAPAKAPGDDASSSAPATATAAAPTQAETEALAEAIARLQPHLQTSPNIPPAPMDDAPAQRADAATPGGPVSSSSGRAFTDAAHEADVIDLERRLQALHIPVSYYERICSEHAADIDAMEQSLEALFEARRHPRPEGYYTSGKFHLPRALQAQFRQEATGITDARVYRRKAVPTQPNVGFVLVLDVSGSMQGDRMTNLQRGAVVLLEPARRLQMDMGIISYDSFPHVLKQPTDDLSPQACEGLLHELTPRNKNNELSALQAASTMATQMDADDVYILFVTDGGGDPQMATHIGALERDHPHVKVVGVGIGPGCAEVPRLYPHHLSVPEINALPQQLADLFLRLQTQSSEEL